MNSMDLNVLNKRFLKAVDDGDIHRMENLLSEGACVNYQGEDDGTTPLIKAVGNKNIEAIGFLVQKGADVNAHNKKKQTALHFAAEDGYAECISLLLEYKANSDFADENGLTPVHYADRGDNLKLIEELIVKTIKSELSNIGKGGKPIKKRIHVAKPIPKEDIIGHLDLTNVPLGEIKLYANLKCKRTYDVSLQLNKEESLISDEFRFSISGKTFTSPIELDVPLYDHPDPNEEVHIKTDRGVIEDKSAILEGPTTTNELSGTLRWKIKIRLNISLTKSLILITTPKLESFEVKASGGEFKSKVDDFIKIKVAPNTFQAGTIDLKVLSIPEFNLENFKTIISIGQFYDLRHSLGCNQFKENGVTFTIPLPHEYKKEGELCILTANVPVDFDPDIHSSEKIIWEMLDRGLQIKRGRVSCNLSHFSTHVLAEKRPGIDHMSFINQVNEIHTKVMKKTQIVRFFAVLKHMTGNFYKTILECAIPQKIDERLSYWKSEDFISLSPECTGYFESCEKQEYDIISSGNIKIDLGTTKLQFHSKRINFQQLGLSLANIHNPTPGALEMVEIPKKMKVTSIIIQLSNTSSFDNNIENQDRFKGFNQEELLMEIASDIGPTWTQFSVLLGVPFNKVHEINAEVSTIKDKIMKVLLEWRKNSQHLDDMGVVDLVTALSRVERNDIVNMVHQYLKDWLHDQRNEFNKNDRFYVWAKTAVEQEIQRTNNDDYLPQPMSDEFFVLLVERYANPEFQNLGVLLGIPENQNSTIFAETLFPSFQYKCVQMLKLALQKKDNAEETLNELNDALKELNMMDAREWVRRCMNEWYQRTKATME